MQVLETKSVKDIFDVGSEGEIPAVNSFFRLAREVRHLEEHIGGLGFSPLEGDERLEAYPYNRVPLKNPEMEMLIQMGSHDLISLPAFNFGLLQLLDYFRKEIKNSGGQQARELLSEILLSAYKGAVLNFEAFKAIADRDYPQEELNLAEILTITKNEAVIRFLELGADQLEINGRSFILRENGTKSIKLNIQSDPELRFKGNQAALRLVLYQLLVNTSRFLLNRRGGGEIAVDAKNCLVNKGESQVPIIAVRFRDNGPGIDFAEVLRRKQKEVSRKPAKEISPDEKKYQDQWLCLDLRLIEVLDQIFAARIGYSDYPGFQAGMGLGLAKQIIDLHGGAIWVTNRLGKGGVEFLLLFDPTADGRLKRDAPELFQNKLIPAEILNALDQQLDDRGKKGK